MTKLHELHKLGQSTWLNYMRRGFIESGELRQRIGDGIQGVTANAAIFERVAAACADYDDDIRREVAAGTPLKEIQEHLRAHDARTAADFLHAIFEESAGLDGFASLEIDPAHAQNTDLTIAAARHMGHQIDRGNSMVEIPATPAGLEAVTALIGDGQSVNITHIFSVAQYERAAQAYLDGMEYLFRVNNQWPFTPTAVASFSVSAIDSAIDDLLLQMGHPELQGQAGIAMAKVAYDRYRHIFSGPDWEKMVKKEARPLRLKWTRTTPRSFSYPDTYYVDALIGPDTIVTFSPATLNAFLDHGTVSGSLTMDLDKARAHLERLTELGLDLEAIAEQLQRQYLIASEKQFQAIMAALGKKRDELESNWQPMRLALAAETPRFDETFQQLCEDRVMGRVWTHDTTLWPAATPQQLGWLNLLPVMRENVGRLRQMAQKAAANGLTHAVVIGSPAVTQTANLFYQTFGKPAQPPYLPYPWLEISAFSPALSDVAALDDQVDPARTLFIIAEKEETEDVWAAFNHLYQKTAVTLGEDEAGRHFMAITDPGSVWIDTAVQHNFRHLFLNAPHVSEPFAALSYFGLVPAALAGADLESLLFRASAMAANAEICHGGLAQTNLAAKLGTALGVMARNGRDQITFITSLAIAGLGDWAAQLLAGLDGLTPIAGDVIGAPDSYGDDRFFIHLRLKHDTMHDTAVQALSDAGHPVLTLHLEDTLDVGGQLFLWQMAAAVAGHLLAVNPFGMTAVPLAAD